MLAGLSRGQGDAGVKSSAEVINGSAELKILADLDASATKDALATVVDDGWAVLDGLDGNGVNGKTGLLYAEFVGVFLEVAFAGLIAGQTVVRMVGEQELNNHAAGLAELFGVGTNDHARSGRMGTGRHEGSGSFELDKAEPAGTAGR